MTCRALSLLGPVSPTAWVTGLRWTTAPSPVLFGTIWNLTWLAVWELAAKEEPLLARSAVAGAIYPTDTSEANGPLLFVVFAVFGDDACLYGALGGGDEAKGYGVQSAYLGDRDVSVALTVLTGFDAHGEICLDRF